MVALGAWLAETALGKWFAGSAAKSFLSAIPRPVWEALTVLAYVVALFALHQHYVHAHDAKLTASINAEWQRKLDAQVAEIKQKDAQLATISAQLRKANDEANLAIAADARDLRLRGPGKATCPRVSSAPAAAGGHVQTAPAADAPVAPLPDAGGIELIALPFDDATRF